VKVRIFRTPDQAARAVARILARRLKICPTAVLGLPTGRTFVPIYGHVVRLQPDFSRARTFNVDEFVGLRRDDPRSFRSFMERHLFARVDISPRHVNFLRGTAVDLDAECARFDRSISAAGGIDLLMLGIGDNGHIGFNEPARDLVLRTHRARLAAGTRRACAALLQVPTADVPRDALSMGVGTLLAARAIVLAATGRSKARAVVRMLNGRVSPAVPASFLQLHPDVTLVLDAAAADEL
jgi:glucosamine-6-phosphate deaminase